MNLRRAAAALVRIIVPVLAAGLFRIGFPAVFIPAFKAGNSLLVALGWLSAPLVTGAGIGQDQYVYRLFLSPIMPGHARAWDGAWRNSSVEGVSRVYRDQMLRLYKDLLRAG
jgi:hypothetical protein